MGHHPLGRGELPGLLQGQPRARPRNAAYSIGTGRGWDSAEPRWDLNQEPNEANRFGWIVELDPTDPTSTPRKHTPSPATGFSTGSGPSDRAHNLTLLENDDLYVARLDVSGDPASTYDGTGVWLPLVLDGRSQVPGFTTEEVLIFTRDAADRLNPTPMDRPEDVQRNPHNGFGYAALTNNRPHRSRAREPPDRQPLRPGRGDPRAECH